MKILTYLKFLGLSRPKSQRGRFSNSYFLNVKHVSDGKQIRHRPALSGIEHMDALSERGYRETLSEI